MSGRFDFVRELVEKARAPRDDRHAAAFGREYLRDAAADAAARARHEAAAIFELEIHGSSTATLSGYTLSAAASFFGADASLFRRLQRAKRAE